MGWASLRQAEISGVISLVCFVLVWSLQVGHPLWLRARVWLLPVFGEFTFICALYSLWQYGGRLPWTHPAGAMQRAVDIERLEHWLHLPREVDLQNLVIHHDLLAWGSVAYYACVHVTAMVFFLPWLFFRHREAYPHWRNGLVGLTASSLFLHFIRVAPPRLVPGTGFVDMTIQHGFSVYGPVGTVGITDQYAAMPSLHVGWAAVVGIGVLLHSTSKWRWLFFLHFPITVFVVAATGNHWWMDGIAALALLWASLAIDSGVRRLVRAWRARRAEPVAEPVTVA